MEARFDFAAAWGGGYAPPPELPHSLWNRIASGDPVAGLVEPDDSYGRLTAVMALRFRDLTEFVRGAIGFKRPREDVIALTFLPGEGAQRAPIDVEFDLTEPGDRAVMIELSGQQAMNALWIDVAELVVVRRALMSLEGVRGIVDQVLGGLEGGRGDAPVAP
ncbi:MAG TPA: hypothetical protein VNT51_00560 [Miltoncostaeaceae bacterium]|nr:hypothetical protein [Miltoncostaeaceae bacterium]